MSEALIEAARQHWGLKEASITLIAQRENHVFRVDTARTRYALRLHRPGLRTEAELQSELDWMAMLADNGIPVPAPVRARSGSQSLTVASVTMDLLGWVDGVSMADRAATAPDFRALGQLMARMHELADKWDIPLGFSRPRWDLVSERPLWGRFWDNPAVHGALRRTLLQFRDHCRSVLADGSVHDYGLIHADLVPDNVLISDKGLHPIDFDDGGFGHRLFDLATVTHRSRRLDPDGTLAAACVEGYLTERQIDLSALPLFEALRACTYLGWIIPRLREPGADDRNHRFLREAQDRLAVL